jgi:hypothetical protein
VLMTRGSNGSFTFVNDLLAQWEFPFHSTNPQLILERKETGERGKREEERREGERRERRMDKAPTRQKEPLKLLLADYGLMTLDTTTNPARDVQAESIDRRSRCIHD